MSNIRTQNTEVYTDRKNNIYKNSDEINFYIPPTFKFLNPKDLYMIANLKLTGNLKTCVSDRAGAYSLFRSVQTSSGDGSTVFEVLDNYAILDALRQYYTATESLNNLRYLHEGKPNKSYIGDSSANQYCDPTKSTGHQKTVELCLPLYLSGLCKPDREKVLVNLALNGLRIKIQLNNPETVCQVIKAPLFEMKNGRPQKVSGEYGGYDTSQGYLIKKQVDGDDKTVILKNDYLNYETDFSGKKVLSPAIKNPAHLFAIGQTVNISGNDYKIEKIEVKKDDEDDEKSYQIHLTFESSLSSSPEENTVVYIKADNVTNTEENFELSRVRMNVSHVNTDPSYIDSIVDKINKGEMNIEYDTYTDYGVNISAGSNNNSLYINARNGRAKSILSVGQNALANSFEEDSFKPDTGAESNSYRDYNYNLYGVVTPDRMVKLNRFNDKSFNAIALREMMLSLNAAGISVNTVREAYEHFFIGRRLALPGYSYNCNRPNEGQIRLNVNFNSVTSLLMHNFLMHKRQLQIRPGSMQVVY